jgi:hypothetical protein
MVLIPAGEKHMTRNTGSVPLVLLCFFPTPDVSAATVEFPGFCGDAERTSAYVAISVIYSSFPTASAIPACRSCASLRDRSPMAAPSGTSFAASA